MINEDISGTPYSSTPPLESRRDEHHHHYCCYRFSWTAVFVGALVGVGLGFLFNLLGIAIGLSTFSSKSDGAVIAIGGLIGVVIGIIISMIIAGYAAGYLGRIYALKHNLGILYGFVTWILALIISAIMAGHVSHYVGAYSNSMAKPVATSTATLQGETGAKLVTVQTPAKSSININTSSPNLAWTAITIFVLFLIGAISACIGACWACCRCDKHRIE